MGFVQSLLSSDKGAGYQASGADLLPVTNGEQIGGSFNTNRDALQAQQALVNALGSQGGLQNQSDVYNQLSNVGAGTGPNPAQAQLANATAANTANQAALMAGQRGASSNPALIARMAAQQGAANQQNAVGQAAALQAQQQLNALGAMGSLANQQVSNQIGAQQAYGNQALQSQNNLLGAAQGLNQARVGMQSNQNSANAGIAGINAQNQAKMFSGALSGASGIPMASGGMVPADSANQSAALKEDYKGPKSKIGQHFHKMASGGKVFTTEKKVVPGKADVKGNSYANDKVKALLSPGEIVLPRSVTQAKNAPDAAAKFVQALLAKKK